MSTAADVESRGGRFRRLVAAHLEPLDIRLFRTDCGCTESTSSDVDEDSEHGSSSRGLLHRSGSYRTSSSRRAHKLLRPPVAGQTRLQIA
jgi:hypothetical protein